MPGYGARASDPTTSHDAFKRPGRAVDRLKVLMVHAKHARDGLTDFELAELVRRQQTSAGKRRGELRDKGLIQETAHRRPAPSGTLAIVWKITPDGMREALTMLTDWKKLKGL